MYLVYLNLFSRLFFSLQNHVTHGAPLLYCSVWVRTASRWRFYTWTKSKAYWQLLKKNGRRIHRQAVRGPKGVNWDEKTCRYAERVKQARHDREIFKLTGQWMTTKEKREGRLPWMNNIVRKNNALRRIDESVGTVRETLSSC